MSSRRRLIGALLALLLPTGALTALPVVSDVANADAPAVPPACAYNDPDTNCVHGPTPDISALPAPTFTTTFDPKTHIRSVIFNAAIVPPYHTCPGGGVPISYLPCTFAGLAVGSRVYVPGATAALSSGPANTVPPNADCGFNCTVQINLDYTYHGPATLIVSFGVGELLQGQNDLAGSSYESTITLPADPVTGVVHVTKPTVAYSGPLKTMTLQFAGHGSIPRTGVGGLLVRVVSKGEGGIQGGDTIGNGEGLLAVVPGTKLRVHKDRAGATTITTMGWYSSQPETTGDLIHRLTAGVKKLRIGANVALTPIGVPSDATGVLVAVISPKGTTTVGGTKVTTSFDGNYVLVPLKPGAHLPVKAAKGARIYAYGYTEPIHVIDTGTTLSTTVTDDLSDILALPQQDSIF